jgi:hypothetical protein
MKILKIREDLEYEATLRAGHPAKRPIGGCQPVGRHPSQEAKRGVATPRAVPQSSRQERGDGQPAERAPQSSREDRLVTLWVGPPAQLRG